MKQYIKKALWIMPFVFFSTQLLAKTFYYVGGTVGSTGNAGNNLSNWNDNILGTGTAAVKSDFTTANNEFDVNGRNVDLGNLVIGQIIFGNSSSTSVNITIGPNKILWINSQHSPSFINITGATSGWRQLGVTFNASSTAKIHYNNNTAGVEQEMISGITHPWLIVSGNNKKIDDLFLARRFSDSSSTGVTVSINLYLILGSQFNTTATNAFSVKTNTTFKLNNNTEYYHTLIGSGYSSDQNLYFIDMRSTKSSYLGIWQFNDNINYGYIPPGTYANMTISSHCALYYDSLNGGAAPGTYTTIINNDINMSAAKTLALKGQILELKGTSTNVNAAAGGKIIGDIDAQIISSGTITLYFDNTTSASTYTLNDLTISGGTFTMGNNLIVGTSLNLSSGLLSIGPNTLTIEGSIAQTSGYIKGSNLSSIICPTTNSLYFDQTGGETNRTLKNLTITNGATISLGNWLNITGGSSYGLLTVNSSSKCSTNNYLILKADADGYAQVANSAGSIVGNIHVQTYFPSTAGRGYRFISSQVKDGYFYSLRDSGSVASGGSTYGAGKNRTANVGIQITGSGGSSKGFDVSTTNNPSAFYFNEANAGNYGLGAGTDGGWTSISDVSSTGDKMVSGKGYRVLIRGDRTINLTGTASNNIATTTQITGTYPGSSVQTTITNTGAGKNNNGINLVGNPYPANLSWTAIKNANTGIGLDAAYAVYDVVNGRYNVYNASAGTGTASDDIAAGQGFLVYTSSSSATFTINESCKNTAAKGDRYFKKQRSNHLVITMSYDTLYSDKSIVYFLPGSSTSYDEFDGGHIQNPYVNLSSLDATNSQYALNCLDTLETERTVPLSVKGTAPGDFSMTFEDCGTFLNNDIYLFDKFLNKKVKIDDWTKYDFSITADPFSAEDGRLSLFFTPKETNKLTTIEKTTSFSISPNPVTDNFIINYKGKNNVNIEYSIVNAGGQEVKKGKIQTNDKVNTKDLARGIYFMTIKSQTESQTIKFIK